MNVFQRIPLLYRARALLAIEKEKKQRNLSWSPGLKRLGLFGGTSLFAVKLSQDDHLVH